VVAVRQHLEQTTDLMGLTLYLVLSHQSVVALAQEKEVELLEMVDQVVVQQLMLLLVLAQLIKDLRAVLKQEDQVVLEVAALVPLVLMRWWVMLEVLVEQE
jgi:hypothetical protein